MAMSQPAAGNARLRARPGQPDGGAVATGLQKQTATIEKLKGAEVVKKLHPKFSHLDEEQERCGVSYEIYTYVFRNERLQLQNNMFNAANDFLLSCLIN